MHVLVAPDSFGGTLTPLEAATVIAAGWRRVRPEDRVTLRPMSDGGEGLLDALLAAEVAADHALRHADVAGGDGVARAARWLLLDDGTAVLESAEACGLVTVPPDRRDPRRTTTWGVGQLLEAARVAGATRVLVGLGGSASVDGGAGALGGLGHRLTVADGSGLKVGGEDLPRVRAAARTWVGDWTGTDVRLLADVTDVYADAPARYGPQKGADPATVAHLEQGLAALRTVLERDLGLDPAVADQPGSAAAGGLALGLAAGVGGEIVRGVDVVADLVGLDVAMSEADLVLTGEGALDATSWHGKVVGEVCARADRQDTPVAVVAGRADDLPGDLSVETASLDGRTDEPADAVAAAAARLATRWSAGDHRRS